MNAPKPFSPETLADRWGCSSEKIRRMYHDGELVGFRLGKLIRIPANEVERVECLNTQSESTEESTSSPIAMSEGVAFAPRLARMTGDSPKLAPVKSGKPEQPQSRSA